MNTSPEALLISISKILFDGIGLLLILKLNSKFIFLTEYPILKSRSHNLYTKIKF